MTAEANGLSTIEAFRVLAADIDQVLKKHCAKSRSPWRTLRLTLFDAVTWNWRSLIFTAVFLIFLLLAIIYERRPTDIIMFLLVLGVSIFNTILPCKVRWMRWTLCKQRVEKIRATIDELIAAENPWDSTTAYPSLFQPTSPSVHLQWVFRDAHLVNLPACLLVRGDLILLRPGQEIFAECRAAKPAAAATAAAAAAAAAGEMAAAAATAAATMTTESPDHFAPGQVYTQDLEAAVAPGGVSTAVQHSIQLPRNFEVIKTPFIDSLELLLVRGSEEQSSCWRSIPERVMAEVMNFLYIASAILFILGLVEAVALRLAYPEGAGPLSEVFLRPVYAAYCLFPLLCPIFWFLIRAWIGAQFRLFSGPTVLAKDDGLGAPGGPVEPSVSCDLASSASSMSGSDRLSLLQRPKGREAVTAGQQLREILRVLSWWDAAASELVFNLGTLTALCCVDKKGVLSLSQPTVDKVFFLRRRHHRHGSLLPVVGPCGSLRQASRRRSEVSVASTVRRDEAQLTIGSQGSGRYRLRSMLSGSLSEAQPPGPQFSLTSQLDFHAHVLEVSNLRSHPYEQSFQERHWRRYLNSLKPIGLNILLNNCNPDMFPRYTALADYLTLLADRSPEGREVAAINHRCMCGLARQIGFMESATQPFQLATSLAAFRHAGANLYNCCPQELPGEEADGPDDPVRSQLQERLFRALSSSRHRTPMAHVLSAVTTQARVGCLQLMSQGSADLLLDLCVDYWDGHNLSPLREAEKRRALDFYHRHIHSAYCTAFAYSPLFESIAESLADVVLELPSQGVALTAHIPRRALPGVQTVNEMTSVSPPVGSGAAESTAAVRISAVGAAGARQSLTTEATLSPAVMAELSRNRSMSAESMLSRLSADSISTSEECLDLLRNQVFLGMASLQYQPLADVVPMVKNLQEACIRFVHFSQENELRSRVFAEKLGLEAGSFNCHISLAENGRVACPGQSSTNNDTPSAGATHRCSQSANDNIMSRWDSAPVVMGNTIYNYVARTAAAAKQTGKAVEGDVEGIEDEPLSFMSRQHEGSVAEEVEAEAQAEAEAEKGDSGSSDAGTHASLIDGSISSSDEEDTEEEDTITHHLRQDKSQMPRGISAIRPHLSNVDNIPLQVSLFTDCGPDAVREMLEIMQENGEIVTVVGSTLSLHNTAIFLQADCSLGLRPEIPCMCIGQTPAAKSSSAAAAAAAGKEAVVEEEEEEEEKEEKEEKATATATATAPEAPEAAEAAEPAEPTEPRRSVLCSPTDLASGLLSLACSMAGFRARGFRHLVPNVAEARALVKRLRYTMSFYFLACLFISIFQLLSVAVGWPNGPSGRGAFDFFLFDGSCLMFLQLVTIPILCLPILLSRRDKARIMKSPPTKRDPQWVHKLLRRVALYGCARFLPSLGVLLLLAHCSVLSVCVRADIACVLRIDNSTETERNGTIATFTNAELQRSAGQFSFIFGLCFLAVISLSYAADGRKMWKIEPSTLKLWAVFSSIHIGAALIGTVPLNLSTFAFVHPAVYAAGVLWLLFLLPLNELVNRQENSISLREERRARFMFNTKLGMYSPV